MEPIITEVFKRQMLVDCSSMTAWPDPNFRKAIEAIAV